MKHPASTAAALLLGVALLVGGATWLLSPSQSDDGQAAQLAATGPHNEVGFVAATPKEQHKALNMERATREMQRIKDTGKEIAPGLYMIPDANGDPTYYSTEIYKGRGRNGEPLYFTVQMKKSATEPLLEGKQYFAKGEVKVRKKPLTGVVKFGNSPKKKGGAAGSGSSGASPAAGGSGATGSGGGGSKQDG